MKRKKVVSVPSMCLLVAVHPTRLAANAFVTSPFVTTCQRASSKAVTPFFAWDDLYGDDYGDDEDEEHDEKMSLDLSDNESDWIQGELKLVQAPDKPTRSWMPFRPPH